MWKILRDNGVDTAYRLPMAGQLTDIEHGKGSEILAAVRDELDVLGRFITKDPSEERGGLNLYGFCRNNGTNGWDILGMKKKSNVERYSRPLQQKTDHAECPEKDPGNRQNIDPYAFALAKMGEDTSYAVRMLEGTLSRAIQAQQREIASLGALQNANSNGNSSDREGIVTLGELEVLEYIENPSGPSAVSAPNNAIDGIDLNNLHPIGLDPSAKNPANATLRTSSAGVALIAELEGFRGAIYKDQAGYPTIGFGHKLLPGEAARYAKGISRSGAEVLLGYDLAPVEATVRRLVGVPMEQGMFDGLVSFSYNVGPGAFARSTLLTRLNSGDILSVPEEMARWNKVTIGGAKVESDGLSYRRWREGWAYHGWYNPDIPWPPPKD